MTQARKALDRDADQPTEEWLAFLGPAELDGIEGTCLLELGRADRAAVLLQQAIDGCGDRYARTRALYRIRLARARIIKNTIDGAAETATAALDDLGHVRSWRVSSELTNVAQQLAPYPHEPLVANFLANYAARTAERE